MARHLSTISDVTVDADLQRGNCIVDIQLSMLCGIDEREDIITDMHMAGYKLRSEEIHLLTFLKDFD